MSGHSKWATIKRQKGANDAKRGQIFTKLGREIVIAAREGGPDPEGNFRLRLVLDKARQANMPKENIERAIKRGSGEAQDGAQVEEYSYEGYGPHGTAMIVQAYTDNRNRTVSEVRHVFARYGGNLGADGSVSWMFNRRGVITIEVGNADPDEVALAAIDAGAEDVQVTEATVEVYTAISDFASVRTVLSEAGYNLLDSQVSWLPQTQIALDEKDAVTNLKLMEALEDLDDVQQVFSNLEISDQALATFGSQAA